ncbi:MAG TPA: Rrf2 family transcriptional regulator [Anaerolineae bacterium]|nr:Rrf2 family transcriptional regulator [Anaerolineae bacterium]
MQISKEADYALRAVLYLSRLGDSHQVATSKIAAEQHIPSSFLAKIVSRLSSAGIIRTSRGAHGGVSLARPGQKISVLEVVEAIDGPIALNACVIHAGECTLDSTCTLHDIFCQAQETLVGQLKRTTFDQLA